eukprot:1188380-Prorocentrum_minimum.AAC.1
MIDPFTPASLACLANLGREKPQGRAMGPMSLKNLLRPVLCQPSGLIWDLVSRENDASQYNSRAKEENDYLRANSTAEEGTSGRGPEGASVETERLCRFCYGEEDDDAPTHAKGVAVGSGKLVSPCGCVGTQEFVHLSCLREWQVRTSSRMCHPWGRAALGRLSTSPRERASIFGELSILS